MSGTKRETTPDEVREAALLALAPLHGMEPRYAMLALVHALGAMIATTVPSCNRASTLALIEKTLPGAVAMYDEPVPGAMLQ